MQCTGDLIWSDEWRRAKVCEVELELECVLVIRTCYFLPALVSQGRGRPPCKNEFTARPTM